jgi:hypothetical protein
MRISRNTFSWSPNYQENLLANVEASCPMCCRLLGKSKEPGWQSGQRSIPVFGLSEITTENYRTYRDRVDIYVVLIAYNRKAPLFVLR